MSGSLSPTHRHGPGVRRCGPRRLLRGSGRVDEHSPATTRAAPDPANSRPVPTPRRSSTASPPAPIDWGTNGRILRPAPLPNQRPTSERVEGLALLNTVIAITALGLHGCTPLNRCALGAAVAVVFVSVHLVGAAVTLTLKDGALSGAATSEAVGRLVSAAVWREPSQAGTSALPSRHA